MALGVFSEYKNSGIGKMLIEYPKTLGVDYIWGYQLKALENINDWLKRRKIYLQTPGLYVTYQIFNDNEEKIILDSDYHIKSLNRLRYMILKLKKIMIFIITPENTWKP